MSDRGMKVPDGIDEIVDVVPSEIPAAMFGDAKRASVRKAQSAKPASLPKARVAAAPVPDPDPFPTLPSLANLYEEEDEAAERAERLSLRAPPSAPSSVSGLVTSLRSEGSVAPSLRASRAKSSASGANVFGLAAMVAGGIVLFGAIHLFTLKAAVSHGRASLAVTVRAQVPAATASYPREDVAPAAPIAAKAPVAAPEPPPEPAPEPASDIPSGMGRLNSDRATRGRRIFVDRRTVGQTPEPVLVRCGQRRVRVGSAGKTVTVDVPCGGSVDVR